MALTHDRSAYNHSAVSCCAHERRTVVGVFSLELELESLPRGGVQFVCNACPTRSPPANSREKNDDRSRTSVNVPDGRTIVTSAPSTPNQVAGLWPWRARLLLLSFWGVCSSVRPALLLKGRAIHHSSFPVALASECSPEGSYSSLSLFRH